MFARNFPNLPDGSADISEAIAAIQAQFSGALNYFWQDLDSTTQELKRNLLFNYLVAWYLADQFSESLSGVVGNGGMPLVKKSLGGIDLTFLQYKIQEDMKIFTTNVFGIRALQMILTAPERFGIRGSSTGIWPMPTQGIPPVLL
jgi:hypothetical protein